MLACAGDGSKLRPMVIFKRKTVPKVANKHGVVITAQEKGWMDTEGMKTWVQKVWRARRGGLGRRRSLLVYDAFEAHVTESVKAAFLTTSFPGYSLYLEKVPWLRLVTCLLDFSRFQRCD